MPYLKPLSHFNPLRELISNVYHVWLSVVHLVLIRFCLFFPLHVHWCLLMSSLSIAEFCVGSKLWMNNQRITLQWLSAHCPFQGPVSLTVFPSQSKVDVNFVLLSHRLHYRDRYKILCMARQLCCRGMCKNLLRSDGQQRSYGKAKFPSYLNCGQKTVSETGPWSVSLGTCILPVQYLCGSYLSISRGHPFVYYYKGNLTEMQWSKQRMKRTFTAHIP